MIDLHLIREQPEVVRAALARREAEHLLEAVIELDNARRELVFNMEAKQHEQNLVSKQIGKASADERPALLESARELKSAVEAMEPAVTQADEGLRNLMSKLPNLPDESVPAGRTDDDNVEIRSWGDPKEFDGARDHLDLGRRLGLIDTERGVRTSGSRFTYLMGDAVLLQFALVRYAMDKLFPHGFEPVVPPSLVLEETMFGAGALPGDAAQYYTVQDGLYLTGTSEQALVAIHAGETLPAPSLPLRYVAYSPCFRREAGTYGRDTRGIWRLHQFDKVEMFSFAHPDKSCEEHDFLVAREEELIQSLGIPYRVMNVCTGELGAPAAKKFDIEAWLPGRGRYGEITSCSNCTDFQARRMNIRTDERRIVHTLNGTAFAIGRTLVALFENHQDDDGSIAIPEVLHQYLPPDMKRISKPGRFASG